MQSENRPPQGENYGAPIPPPQGGPSGYPPQGGPGYGGPGYGGPGYGGPTGPPVNTTMPLVFGILGILCCGIFGPFALTQANKGMVDLDRGMGNPTDRSTLNIARILGIIGCVFLVLQILYVIFIGGLIILGASQPRTTRFPSQPPTFGQPR